MDCETDAYRGHKRKARVQEVIELVDSDSDDTTVPAVDRGHSSKKHKKTPSSAPPLRKRTTSYGRKRDEDCPDSVPIRPSMNYIVISDDDDDDDDDRTPVTPTPAQRTTTRVNGSGSKDRCRGPRTTNQARNLPVRPAQNGPQHPFQQDVQQAIKKVVHQPQYVDVLQQDVQKALQEELEKTAQDFLQRTQTQSSPPARDQLAARGVIAGTESHSPSATQNQLAARPKTKATPKKKSQSTCSSLPADYFCTIPTEVRENIFRHLLISNKPIQVSKIWTDVARAITRRTGRCRLSAQQRDEADDDTATTIDARILSVCRQAHQEGSRILYSENTFFYKLRDGDSVPFYALTPSSPACRRPARDTAGGRAQDWHTTWLASNKPGPINFGRYGPLLRRLRVELEPNRSTDEKYENLLVCALEALVSRPGIPISLHVLSLAISPSLSATGGPGGPRYLSTAPFFAPGHRAMKALQKITTNYLHLNLHVDLAGTTTHVLPPTTAGAAPQPFDPDDSDPDSDALRTRHLETTIDMRYTAWHMAAVPPSDAAGADLWARDALMPAKRAARGRRAETCLAQLRRRIEGACADPDEAIRRNWFDDVDDAEFLRMRSATGWVGTCEVEDADEIEDRVLVVRFGRDAAGRMVVVRT
ncbi:hypothetical protein B0T18DRAFT_444392 [Schizothecium vesticola]|uniref:F-box domain-containing protein n=1 Tax=Schizothecium vesticola TaxID=314040 RepID=A0AA40KAH2_9PEZI|nr:hypothetical protein B0T18DRAFT_444392 [Schizothecium vesticola]